MRMPLTNPYPSFFGRHLRPSTKPGRLVPLFVLLGLLSTVALSSFAASNVLGSLFFGAAGERTAAKAKQRSFTFAEENEALSAPAPDSSSSLTAARTNHSATVLADGKVLIVGGENGDGFVAAAEIFDPATGSSSATGNLNTPRADHTATRLADGRVLIAGGRAATEALSSTEIFNPVNGAFTPGADLNSARAGHSATTLGDGRILIAGGDSSGSAEIYDPQAGTFSATASMGAARSGHSAVLMQDGRVLVVGGRDAGGNALSSGEIFDASNSTFADAGSMEDARAGSTLRVLPDGKIQIIGGNDHRSIEIYDPAAGIFGAHAHLPPDNDEHPALLTEVMSSPSRAAILNNGQTITELSGEALVAGGTDLNGNATNAVTLYSSSAVSVTTDVLDYPPGTPVIINGRGFQPNEVVDLTFHEDPHVNTENPHAFTVQADANGNFTFDQYAPELADIGVTYILGAKGESSGLTAQTTFKDALKITVSRDNPAGATLNLASGDTFSVQFKIENSNNAGNLGTNLDGNYTLTFPSGLSLQAGAPATSGSFTGLSGTSPLILQWSFQAPTGPATGLVISLSANITSPSCSAGGGNQCSNSATYTVNVTAPANSAPVASAVSISGTAQYGQLLSGNYTYSDADSDLQGTSTFRWLRNGTTVVGTNQTYTTISADVGQTLTFEVTPVAATGTSPGTAVQSSAVPIGKAPLTVTASSHTVTYGDPVPTVTPSYATFVSPDTAADIDTPPTCITTYTTTSTAGSSQTTSCSGGLDNNYSFSFVAGTVTINKANATFTVTPYDVTYDGLEHTAAVSTITGVNGETGATVGTVDVSNTKHTNAATYSSDSWSFTGTANYNDQGPTTITDKINKADATFTVTPYDVTYDGLEHTATVSTITGVNGETGATVGTVDVTNTKHTNAGTYSSDSWSFTGTANYNNQGPTTITDKINKRDTLTTVSSSLNPSIFGQSVSFTATVVGSGAGAGDPTGGFVQFKIDGSPFGPVVGLVGGSATSGATTTLTVTTTTTHTVEAIFASTDPNFNNSSDQLDGGQQVGAWTLTGFYQPVGIPNTYHVLVPPMSGITWNSIKGGQTVPLKFNVFAGTVEQTTVAAIAGFTVQEVACLDVNTTIDDVDFVTTGATQLRYDGTPGAGGQFIQNWQTPKTPNKCYRTVVTTADNSVLVAFFMTKK